MPIMNGYVCAQKIKAFHNQKTLFDYNEGKDKKFCPFLIAYSAFVDKDVDAKAKDCGFDIVV
jgi:hypothetical protein